MKWKETIQHYAKKSNISEPLTVKLTSLTALLEDYLVHNDKEPLRELAANLPDQAASALDKNGGEENRELVEKIGEEKYKMTEIGEQVLQSVRESPSEPRRVT